MSLSNQRFVDLLASFRAPDPTPGGGSASALVGAVGAALLAMVAALPKPRLRADADAVRLGASRERCAALSQTLAALMDRDSGSYDQVLAAFRLPKNNDDEKTVRGLRIQEALRAASDAPLEVMRACANALHEAVTVAELGNANASSDVGVALELLSAGLRGARLNVEVNLASLKDQTYVAATRRALEQLSADADRAQAAGRAHLPG
jgi:formiminotetrahydrofolate cyclodeaminase